MINVWHLTMILHRKIKPLRVVTVFLFVTTLFAHSWVFAHARWAELDEGGSTPPRSNHTGIKSGPCGNIARGSDPQRPATYLKSGATVTLKIYQDIYHAGDYRIYFSEKGDEGLFVFENGAIVSQPSEVNTLLPPNQLFDEPDKTLYDATVTLPDIECDECTLQLIQYMPDRTKPYYYSCADIRLTENGTADSDVDVTPPDAINDLAASVVGNTVFFTWFNPSTQFDKVVVVQSEKPFDGTLINGNEYRVNDKVGNGEIIFRKRQNAFSLEGLLAEIPFYFSFFTVDQNNNYSEAKFIEARVMTSDSNLAPKITLSAEQNQVKTFEFFTDDGPVLIHGKVSDPNKEDSHQWDWSQTSGALADLDAEDATLTVDPTTISPGEYWIELTVTDDGEPQQSATVKQKITVSAPPNSTDGDDATAPQAGGGGGLPPIWLSLLGFVIFRTLRSKVVSV